MQSSRLFKLLAIGAFALAVFDGCKKTDTYPPLPDAVYIIANLITGPGSTASTAITNSASGKVSVSPAVGRVYLNTLKTFDVTVSYTLTGTAVAGTNYTVPNPMSVTIPAGQWSADIKIPVINAPLASNKTIIITLSAADNNTQLGLGVDRTYKTFTYTLTN